MSAGSANSARWPDNFDLLSGTASAGILLLFEIGPLMPKETAEESTPASSSNWARPSSREQQIQNLAKNVAQGFAQVSERLDKDIGIVASQIVQFAQRYDNDLGMVMRDLSILAEQVGQIGSRIDSLSADLAKTLRQIRPRFASDSADLGDHEVDGTIRLDFPDFVRNEFPYDFDNAWAATQTILDALPGSDLSPLAERSPGLRGSDGYLSIQLSVIRLVRVGAALRRSGLTGGRVLDFGSYYGNFSLFLRSLGFDVYAADTYGSYGAAFSKMLPLLREAGVKVVDLTEEGRDLASFKPDFFDAVLCMGVIEHVPHTPKPLLTAVNRVLRPEGTLVLDTPNLLYLYTRERLAEGKPILTPMELQFNVEPPFEGHHREYTPSEVRYMLEAIGHEVADLDVYNYSIYEVKELTGSDAARYGRMAVDPELREVIFTRSIKKA
jgi:2-polyprenyl-3-methyl-5-hydroxy-6-metoxy-1,4-benzoquinol methylase